MANEDFAEIKIEDSQVRVEYPETWKQYIKPGILHRFSPSDYLSDYRLYTPKFKTELDFNSLADRAHSANFIEEWIEKEYRDWRKYFTGKTPRGHDVSQPLTIAIVHIFNGLARDVELNRKEQTTYLKINLNYDLKMQYQLAYILARCMRFYNIDICGMQDTPKTESLAQFYGNDVLCRARLLHNFRKGIHIETIVIRYVKDTNGFSDFIKKFYARLCCNKKMIY